MANLRQPRVLDKNEDRERILKDYKASMMSDTKWHKVFAALEAVDPDLKIIIKWVGVEEPRRDRLPNLEGRPRAWGYFSHCGPAPLRSIEWVEVRAEDSEVRGKGFAPVRTAQPVDAIRRVLGDLGQLPIEEGQGGLRVIGHLPNA